MAHPIRNSILALAASAALAHGVTAQTFTVVNVGAPEINCVFSTTCSVTVDDQTAPYLGSGFLQSRVFQAQPGSPAAGKWVYEYRVDLSSVATVTAPALVTHLAIPFAPSALAMDFNQDGKATEQAFVVTSGGLGTVAPASIVGYGDTIHVTFTPGVPGGQSSFFFGFVSANPPHDVLVRAEANVAPETFLASRGASFDAAPAPAAPARPRPRAPRHPVPVRP